MKINCAICNKQYSRIGNHISKHNMTMAEYRLRFPDVPTCGYVHSEATLIKMRGERLSAKGVPKSKEHRQKLSAARMGRKTKPHTAETLEKMRHAWKRRKADVVKYAAYVMAASAQKSTPEAKAVMQERVARMIKSGHHNGKSSNTFIERKMKAFLDQKNIQFEHQFILATRKGTWTFDFFLPSLNLLVETDSEYFHSKLEVINRDTLKERLALEHGYTVARISDKDWRPEIIFELAAVITAASAAILAGRLEKQQLALQLRVDVHTIG